MQVISLHLFQESLVCIFTSRFKQHAWNSRCEIRGKLRKHKYAKLKKRRHTFAAG